MVEWVLFIFKQETLGKYFPPIISLCTKKTLGIINVRSDRMLLLKTRMSKRREPSRGSLFLCPRVKKDLSFILDKKKSKPLKELELSLYGQHLLYTGASDDIYRVAH